MKRGSSGGGLEAEIEEFVRNSGEERRFWGLVLGLEGERDRAISGLEKE